MNERERYDEIMEARGTLPAASYSSLGKTITWLKNPDITELMLAAIPDDAEDSFAVPPPRIIVFHCTYSHRCGYVWEIQKINF